MELPVFTKTGLLRYDGKNGAPAYIGSRGLVYDVTESFLWLGGRHQVVHYAGMDLSFQIALAPQNDELLNRFPVVENLAD